MRILSMTIGKYLNERTIYGWIILILTAFAFFLRIYKLDASSIWLDEAWRLSMALESEHILSAIAGGMRGMSGYIGVLKLLASLTSGNVWDLRLFSAICGTVTVPLTYVLTANFCSRSKALFASSLIAISPILIIYSQDISQYMFSTILVVVQTIIFIRWVQSYSYLYGALFGIISLIVSNILPQSAFLTAGFLLYVLLSTKLQKPNEKKSFILCMLILAPAIFSYFAGITHVKMMGNSSGGGNLFSHFKFWEIFDRIMTSLFNIPNSKSIYSPGHEVLSSWEPYIRKVIGILFTSAAFWAFFQRKSFLRPISIALTIFLFGTGIGSMISNQYFERYFIAVQPLAVVLLVAFISGVLRKFSVIKIPLIMISVLLIFFWGILTKNSAYNVAWKPPNKEAFEIISDHAHNAEEAYCVVPYFYEWPIANYYLKNNSKVILLDPTFEFFGEHLPASIQLTNEDYTRLALQQLNDLKVEKKNNIFLYTQRGHFMISSIVKEMAPDYEEELLYNNGGLQVIKFKLRTK